MVLDAKALTWAAAHNIDTAKLKAAKVPIYGKWYFPEIPAGLPLISLQTGERRTFSERMIAGEVIWVGEAELTRAGLLPADEAEYPPAAAPPPVSPPRGALPAVVEEAPEPLLAMSRPPGLEEHASGTATMPVEDAGVDADLAAPTELPGVHLPSPSIGPFVLGVGFCLALLGVITHPLIVVAGLLWILVGAIVWIRAGLLEERAALNDVEATGEDRDLEPEPEVGL